MKALYFGTSKKPLYGIYQPPTGPTLRRGAVLCYPLGPEYVAAYPAFRQLASTLVRAGFHVFRFDFYGSGDSSGAAGQGGVAQWKTDLEFAIEELRDISGVDEVILVGLRFGASLVGSVAAERDDISAAVLWEPIVRGADYIEELKLTATNYQRRILPRPVEAIKHSQHLEVLGYPVSATLQSEIEQVDLNAVEGKIAEKVLVVERPRPAGAEGRWSAEDPSIEYLSMDAPKIWSREGGLAESLIPFEVVREIAAWSTGVADA